MHDVIIDDTRSSMAASQDRGFREVKKQNPKKKRSFSKYLADWIEKSFIIASFLVIDFLLFASAGSYNMFASPTFFTMEVWYILAGIFILCFALIYLISFSSFLQNLVTAASLSFFIIIMMNQFAAFDKNSMIAQLAATYITPELGEPLSNVSHVVFATVAGLLFFVFAAYASKKILAYFVIFLLVVMGGITASAYSHQSENVKFKIVKDSVIISNAQPGKRFVFIGMPTAGAYNYLRQAMEDEAGNPYEYERLKKTYDNLLGFYAANRFILYPFAYVDDTDPYTNLALVLNANNNKTLDEYKQNNISVTQFWKFNNMNSKYLYLRENKLFDTFKRAKYGINAYQSGGIEMCLVDNKLEVDRCIEKNSRPISLDGMDISIEEKVKILGAQWVESMGIINDFSYFYSLLKPFVDVDGLPLVGVSYEHANVKDSLDVLDMIELDLIRDNGNKAYFADLNLPGNMYIYDEFCQVKPITEWRNKIEKEWVKKGSETAKKNAYNMQLNCIIGRLETFLNNLDKSPAGKKTVVVLQGLSGINGLVAPKGADFASVLKNEKFVDMAIRDPLKKEFQVDESLCSAPNLLKQYLYRKGKCQELSGFNMHADAIKGMYGTLTKFKVDKAAAAGSAEKFKQWYQGWLKNQPRKNENFVSENETDMIESGETFEESTAGVTEKSKAMQTKAEEASAVKEENSAEAEAEGVPEVSEAKTVPETEEAEQITDDEPEKAIGTVKVTDKVLEDKAEDKVENLSTAVSKTEAEKIPDEETSAENDGKAEVQKLVPEEGEAGDISQEVPEV